MSDTVFITHAHNCGSKVSACSDTYVVSYLCYFTGRRHTGMAQQQQEEKEKKPFERLPVDVVPVNYKLELKPDLTAFTFQGQLEITVQV